MPLYDFECGICKHKFDEVVDSFLIWVIACPNCNGPADRILINKKVNHQFKCGGFYKTDYKNQNNKKEKPHSLK